MPDSGNTVGSGAPPSGAFEASAFRRPWHRLVARVLASLNRPLLASAKCYFGGGTRIVMELDEFRESVDIDFICSDRAGYRLLRNAVTRRSLGEILAGDYELVRDVRADMYGIRTFLRVDGDPVKFEIISEGRISLTGAAVHLFPVDALDHPSCIAEKLLAHADRGQDGSTNARDLVDLAFISARWPRESWGPAMKAAESAYGDVIARELDVGLTRFADPSRRRRCVEALGIADPRTLARGLRVLKNHLKER
jgi:hypothetical protein